MRTRTCLRQFAADLAGTTAMTFALALLPLLMLIGAALDFSHQVSVAGRTQAALDAAILSGALRAQSLDDAALSAEARIFFDEAVKDEDLLVDSFTFARAGEQFTATVTGTTTASILGIIGINRLGVNVSSEVRKSERKFEIALALDTTGSMAGAKTAAMKSAANLLVDRMSSAVTNPDGMKISVVPFSATVRLDTALEDEAWLDQTGAAARSADNLISGISRFDLMDHLGVGWSGCVEARRPPFDVTDAAPNPADPDTLFTPLFVPDDRDFSPRFANNYVLDQPSTGNLLADIGNVAKYGIDPAAPGTQADWGAVVSSASTAASRGPGKICLTQPVMPLSKNFTAIKAAISALPAEGSTNITEGLTWAWRTLSPGEPFTEGAAYSDKNVDKIIILLTDGNNHVSRDTSLLGSEYSAYGFVANGNLTGATVGSSQNAIYDALDARTALACQNAKAQGITIYTIRLELADARSETLLRNCATTPDKFLDVPTADQLDEAFAHISNEILQLYLAK